MAHPKHIRIRHPCLGWSYPRHAAIVQHGWVPPSLARNPVLVAGGDNARTDATEALPTIHSHLSQPTCLLLRPHCSESCPWKNVLGNPQTTCVGGQVSYVVCVTNAYVATPVEVTNGAFRSWCIDPASRCFENKPPQLSIIGARDPQQPRHVALGDAEPLSVSGYVLDEDGEHGSPREPSADSRLAGMAATCLNRQREAMPGLRVQSWESG